MKNFYGDNHRSFNEHLSVWLKQHEKDSELNWTYLRFDCPTYFQMLRGENDFDRILRERLDSGERILIDFSMEGFGYSFFENMKNYLPQKHLNQILYVSGAANIEALAEDYYRRTGIKFHTRYYNHWAWSYYFSNNVDYDHRLYRNREKLFLNFNRRLRPSRVSIVGSLLYSGLKDYGFMSFFHQDDLGNTLDYCYNAISREVNQNFSNRVKKGIESLGGEDMILDDVRYNINPVAIGKDSPEFYRKSYVSLVNETFVFEKEIFFSEKIFRPIIYKQPFLLMSTPGSLVKLKEMGFKTYDCVFDESYDSERDHEKRILMVINELNRLSRMKKKTLDQMIDACSEVIQHNYDHFRKYRQDESKERILQYLRDNQNG